MVMEGNLGSKSSFQGHLFLMAGGKKSLPYSREVAKQGLSLTLRCIMCGRAMETNSHLFIRCALTTQMWQLFLSMVGINWTMPATMVELLECWNNGGGNVKHKPWWSLVPVYGGLYGRKGTT